MHRLSVRLSAFSLLLAASLVRAETEAPISSVTLYPGTATIERVAEIPAGTRQLKISGLPANFDTQTLQVQADKGIRLGQIVIKDSSGEEGIHPREKALRKTILELKDRLEALEIEIKSAGLVTGYLGRVDSGDRGSHDGKSLRSVADGIETAAKGAFLRAQQAEIRKRAIKEELDSAEFELAQFRGSIRSFRSLSVQLAAERSGQVRLIYQVKRAGWQPSYRAALDTAQSSLELERLAQVSQKTGEDWAEVKLRLSTGQPLAFREPVDPQTRRIVYHRPAAPEERPRALAAAPMPVMASAPVLAKKAEAKAADDYVAPVIESVGAFSTVFEVPGKVTLPADGREIAVSLGKQNFAAAQRVQIVPAVNRTPVLVAEFERAPGVWLPGPIQVFRDGSYVGATRWNPAANERFALGFGQDDLLRVSAERKTLQDGTAGFTSQRLMRKLADSYTMTNLHRSPIEVLVLESSPVAQSQEIEIERSFLPAPSGEEWKNRPGVVYWNKKMAPDEKWTIEAAYTITYPKEGSVSGLP